jgi:hypothetical protein
VNYLKTHVLARPLGFALAVLMLLTTSYLTLGLSRMASAQGAVGNPRWAVLDFNNNTGYGGAEIGRQAADALDVELFNAHKTEVISRSEIASAVSLLGLQYPLDVIDIQKLGKNLGAQAVVSGDVLSVSRNDKHQVQVVLAVRVTSVASGELINGALAQGSSVTRGNSTDEDAFVNEAIRKAAFAAIGRMAKFNLPLATVLSNQGTDAVLLNKGSRDGYFLGLNMLVLREGRETGRLKVSSVDADTSIAAVTDRGIGIRPQDRAHALFTMPSYTVDHGKVFTTENIASGVGSSPSGKKNNFSGVGGVILAILAAALLLSLINRGGSTGSLGGAQIGSVAAQAIANFVGSDITSPSNVGVRLTWQPGNINARDIVAYNIYRDSRQPINGLPTGTGSTTTTTTTTGTSGTAFDQGPVKSVGSDARFTIDDGNVRTLTFPYSQKGVSGGSTGTTSSSSGSSGSGSGGGGVTVGTLGTGTTTAPALEIGATHPYEVTAVYTITSEVSGTVGYEETPASTGAASGYATPLYPVDPSNKATTRVNGSSAYGATGVNFQSVVITWAETTGATEYVVDLATNNAFTDKKTFYSNTPATGSGGNLLSTANLNLSTTFPGATQIFFRIGARNTVDKPGPYKDPMIPNPDTNPNGGSYIYPPVSKVGFFSGA